MCSKLERNIVVALRLILDFYGYAIFVCLFKVYIYAKYGFLKHWMMGLAEFCGVYHLHFFEIYACKILACFSKLRLLEHQFFYHSSQSKVALLLVAIT
jgi:hypothetical protein